MDAWPAQELAQLLRAAAAEEPSYRGSPQTEEALELLRVNDYAELHAKKSKYIGGSLTWAKVAESAVAAIGKAMLGGDVERAVDAAEDAHALANRLRERDKHPSARVTATTRTRIGQLDALGTCVETAVGLRDETVRPDDFDALGRLLALRTRWYALRRELASAYAENDWVVELVQGAAGRVLSSTSAGAGAKAMATRAVSAWAVASTSVAAPVASTSAAAPAASTSAVASSTESESPKAKRLKLGEGEGERVQWNDDDDLLF